MGQNKKHIRRTGRSISINMELLDQARQAQGLTQIALSQGAGITQQGYTKIRKNQRASPLTARRLAAMVDVPLPRLMSDFSSAGMGSPAASILARWPGHEFQPAGPLDISAIRRLAMDAFNHPIANERLLSEWLDAAPEGFQILFEPRRRNDKVKSKRVIGGFVVLTIRPLALQRLLAGKTPKETIRHDDIVSIGQIANRTKSGGEMPVAYVAGIVAPGIVNRALVYDALLQYIFRLAQMGVKEVYAHSITPDGDRLLAAHQFDRLQGPHLKLPFFRLALRD